MKHRLSSLADQAESFLKQHCVREFYEAPLIGEFSLHRGNSAPDLYGMADAVYILYTVGRLTTRTTRSSRQVWAAHLTRCQDQTGWFSKQCLRGHPKEHASAYAIGALRLLEMEADERYVVTVEPMNGLKPLLTGTDARLRWITRLDFRFTPWHILDKNLGWHYIWRGSHIAGGIPAVVGMARDLIEQWWPDQVDLAEWFSWYFEWLDAHVNPNTGYWQRAFWNVVYRKPTLVDMGGAAHFLWIYQAMNRPFSYPEAVIESTLELQRPSGLYKHHPFCIDLDGNYCLVRSYLELPEERRLEYRDRVYSSAERSFEAIVETLTREPLERIYRDLHELPGALAALVECAKLPGFKYAECLSGWQHPLDEAWWL